MYKILSAMKYYNANTNNSRVGDCTKRALSFAYGLSYDDVSKEMNHIKRSLRQSTYQSDAVWRRFVSDHGDTVQPIGNEDITVSEFAEQHPTGSYVLDVGKKSSDRVGTHLVAVVNGDIYDTWNSQGWYIKYYVNISNAKSEVYSDTIESIAKDLGQFLDDYVAHVGKKLPECMHVRTNGSYYVVDDYTMELEIVCVIDPCPEASDYHRYGRTDSKLRHSLTIKMNPRLTLDDNLDKLKTKLKQQTYNWIYSIRKDVEASIASESIQVSPHYRGNKKLLMQLPEWVRSKVIDADFNYSSSGDWYKFYLCIEADPDDPRYEENDEVTFYADSLSELKDDLDSYKTKYLRYNYDY